MTWAHESKRFLLLHDRLVLWEEVREVDLSRLPGEGTVVVHTFHRGTSELQGADAIDFVMRVAPAFFEGKRFRWLRFGWALHNLVGHPLLQLLSWAGRTRLGLRVHDATVPCPQVPRSCR